MITKEERKRELLEIRREIGRMEGVIKRISENNWEIVGTGLWHTLNGCLEEIQESLEILEEKVCPDCLLEYCECEEYQDLEGEE